MNKTLELHPLCTLFPRLSGYEYDCLKLDIQENGQREPIILHEGMILDGGNRYKACMDLGIEPNFMKFGGDNIVTYVLSANLHRRHLTPGQQAAIVACVQDWAKSQSTPGRPIIGSADPISTTKDRAEKAGVSIETQKRADKVAQQNPELAAEVARGEKTLPQAVEELTGKRPGSKAKPEPEYDPKEHELKEAHDTIKHLAEENDNLKDAIAVGHLPESERGAAEIIADLRKQVKTLEATNSALASQRDSYMQENAQMKKQLAAQRREIEKLKNASAS